MEMFDLLNLIVRQKLSVDKKLVALVSAHKVIDWEIL